MGIQKSIFKSITWVLIFTFLSVGAVPAMAVCEDGCCCAKKPHKKSPTQYPAHRGLHDHDAMDRYFYELGLGSFDEPSDCNACCHQGSGETTCNMEPGTITHVFKEMLTSSPIPETPSAISLAFDLPETAKLKDVGRQKDAFLPLKTSIVPLYLHHLSFLI
jgi:hypothetical protein